MVENQGNNIIDAREKFEDKRILDKIFSVEESARAEWDKVQKVYEEEIKPRGRERLMKALELSNKILKFPSKS